MSKFPGSMKEVVTITAAAKESNADEVFLVFGWC